MMYYRLKWVNGDYLGLGFNSKGKHELKVEILEDLKDTEEEFYEFKIDLRSNIRMAGLKENI